VGQAHSDLSRVTVTIAKDHGAPTMGLMIDKRALKHSALTISPFRKTIQTVSYPKPSISAAIAFVIGAAPGTSALIKMTFETITIGVKHLTPTIRLAVNDFSLKGSAIAELHSASTIRIAKGITRFDQGL
jgi:hypothetical protein